MKHGREKAIKFGASSLVGIVTEPAPGSDSEGKPAFILLNSGILHRVGSCRLSVRLARSLSASGHTCLRFDYSGIGDSDPRRDALPFEQSSVLETREAMDFLAKARGAKEFVLLGLCSGADMAHDTAAVDDRVKGLMLLDAWAYRTPMYYFKYYAPKVFKWRVWQHSIRVRWQMLRGTYRGWRAPDPVQGVELEVARYLRVFPPKERVERELRSFVERGIRMYFLWTGGLKEYNHRGQYAASFRRLAFNGLLREEHLAAADHIVTGLPQQEYLLTNVVGWAKTYWGNGSLAGGDGASGAGSPREGREPTAAPGPRRERAVVER